ncbi:hypothetical protein VTK56DRAFT_1459 [Thermocarpiscus australiensis]
MGSVNKLCRSDELGDTDRASKKLATLVAQAQATGSLRTTRVISIRNCLTRQLREWAAWTIASSLLQFPTSHCHVIHPTPPVAFQHQGIPYRAYYFHPAFKRYYLRSRGCHIFICPSICLLVATHIHLSPKYCSGTRPSIRFPLISAIVWDYEPDLATPVSAGRVLQTGGTLWRLFSVLGCLILNMRAAPCLGLRVPGIYFFCRGSRGIGGRGLEVYLSNPLPVGNKVT